MNNYPTHSKSAVWIGILFGLLVAGSVTSIVLTGSHSVHAQASNSTIKITPIRSDIEVKPGESRQVQISVSNLTSSPLTMQLIENDFIAGDESGGPALVLDADTYAPTHSLKRFMTPLDNITVPAKQTQSVKVTIKVPENAQAGGYFGAVRFVPVSPSSDGQISVGASAASLILLTVPGDVTEELELKDFSVKQGAVGGKVFRDDNSLNTSIRLENKGNIQIGPFGKVTVMRGDKVVSETDFNHQQPRDVILPDSIRRWDIPVEVEDKPGKYRILATIAYGQDNKTIEVSTIFWIIPLWLIISIISAVAGLMALMIAAWVYIKRRRRRHVGRARL